jgi:dTDP-4-dehydrorhamnose reductase
MRVLLLGADGMLGRDLATSVPSGAALDLLTLDDLDITDSAALGARIEALRPELILNAAAYTAVDRAETETEQAHRANAVAVGELGRLAARAGARVVHFSTDYVFSGNASRPYREGDPTDPVNVYGATKLAGERALAHSDATWLIVRTQWLFGAHGTSFPRTMWQRAGAGEATRVVNDQRGRPTYTKDLAAAVWRLIERGARGVLHVANAGEATWFDVAARVFARAGRSDLLTPCSTADFPTPARRPRYSVLDTTRAERALGGPLPRWEEAVDRFLSSLL